MKALLSIKPEYVTRILAGEKRFEYRRRVFTREDVNKIVVYSTCPESAVVAEVEVLCVIQGTPEEVWSKTAQYSGISYEKYSAYFDGVEIAYAISLGQVEQFDRPLPLRSYTSVVKRPPQSFAYVP